jgi:hypothetical protein
LRDRRGLQNRRSLLFRKERLVSGLDAVQPPSQNTCLLLPNHKRKQLGHTLIGRPLLSRTEPAQAGWMSFVMMHLSLGWYCDRFFESAILTQTNNTFSQLTHQRFSVCCQLPHSKIGRRLDYQYRRG